MYQENAERTTVAHTCILRNEMKHSQAETAKEGMHLLVNADLCASVEARHAAVGYRMICPTSTSIVREGIRGYCLPA